MINILLNSQTFLKIKTRNYKNFQNSMFSQNVYIFFNKLYVLILLHNINNWQNFQMF